MTAEKPSQPPESERNSKSEFIAKLESRWSKGNFVCAGLDSAFSQIPQTIKDATPTKRLVGNAIVNTHIEDVIFKFNQPVIDATADLVCAYKLNSAFYEAQGDQGDRALAKTIKYIKEKYPDIPVILDAKRGDIGNTNLGYIESAFDRIRADAITVNPLLGKEALQPFLDRKDKGIIVLAKTSSPGSGEFQDLYVSSSKRSLGGIVRLYEYIANQVANEWNENGNCALVVGATYPAELAKVRKIVGDMPILLPGIGAQGGEVEATVKAGKDSRNMGMIINSSRGIIFASNGPDFAEAARAALLKLKEEINRYRDST